jgi:transposase-like protein
MKVEDREAKAAIWLQRLREAAAAKEPLVEYARRHGLKPGEAYRWRQNLRRAGHWPVHPATSAAGTGAPRFARVRIAAERSALSSAMLCVHLQLANGRRVELNLSDEQLPRVLKLLEQPA